MEAKKQPSPRLGSFHFKHGGEDGNVGTRRLQAKFCSTADCPDQTEEWESFTTSQCFAGRCQNKNMRQCKCRHSTGLSWEKGNDKYKYIEWPRKALETMPIDVKLESEGGN